MPSWALYPVNNGTSAPGRASRGLFVRKASGKSGSSAGTNGNATVLCKSSAGPDAADKRATAFTNNSLGVARRYPVKYIRVIKMKTREFHNDL